MSEKNSTKNKTPVKLSPTLPPNYSEIVAVFGKENCDFDKGIVFVFGNTIHSKFELTQPLFVHECVHVRQQRKEGSAEVWWRKYLTDKNFRKEQEIEAYREQYWFFKSISKDRNSHARYLHNLSTELSSKMYGTIITYSEALKSLR